MNIKNLLEYNPSYAKSVGTNEYYFPDTPRKAELNKYSIVKVRNGAGNAEIDGVNGDNEDYNKGFHARKLLLGAFFPMLPKIVNELTQSQIDQINKTMQTGGRLVIKPTRKRVECGFLGTFASIGIPIAIELVSKMFGKGLQVDKIL